MPNITSEHQRILAAARRIDDAGWIYLHIEGEPYDCGLQHGYYLAAELAETLRVVKFLTRWNTGNDLAFFAEAAGRLFPQHIDQAYLAEIHGIVDGAKLAGVETSIEEILAWNGYEELLGSWWPLVSNKAPGSFKHKKGGHRCSAFVCTGSFTDQGQVVMAHNT